MGVEDRDWYREAQREREKQRQIDETRSKFSDYSRQHLGAKAVSPTRTGLIPMMIFWCVVMGLLYMGMSLTNVKVGVGISASDENDALLGQSFLSKFDITINKNQMVLRSR